MSGYSPSQALLMFVHGLPLVLLMILFWNTLEPPHPAITPAQQEIVQREEAQFSMFTLLGASQGEPESARKLADVLAKGGDDEGAAQWRDFAAAHEHSAAARERAADVSTVIVALLVAARLLRRDRVSLVAETSPDSSLLLVLCLFLLSLGGPWRGEAKALPDVLIHFTAMVYLVLAQRRHYQTWKLTRQAPDAPEPQNGARLFETAAAALTVIPFAFFHLHLWLQESTYTSLGEVVVGLVFILLPWIVLMPHHPPRRAA